MKFASNPKAYQLFNETLTLCRGGEVNFPMIELDLQTPTPNDPAKVERFRDEYFFLSNFYTHNLIFDEYNIAYISGEACYQARKSQDPHVRQLISLLTPANSKKRGRMIIARSDWDQVRIEMMWQTITAKFSLREMKDKLLATGDKYLMEGNYHHDEFFGINLKNGRGRNILGVLLMRLREILRYMDHADSDSGVPGECANS